MQATLIRSTYSGHDGDGKKQGFRKGPSIIPSVSHVVVVVVVVIYNKLFESIQIGVNCISVLVAREVVSLGICSVVIENALQIVN